MENANDNLTVTRRFGWVPLGARQRRAAHLAPGTIWGEKQLEPGWKQAHLEIGQERSRCAPTPPRAVLGR